LIIAEPGQVGDVLPTLIRQVKAASPRTRCLVWADSPSQQQTAKRAGADDVFLKGCKAERLVEGVCKLHTPESSKGDTP
jgi:DNA-binding NarL/FixJ family response regulator